MQKELVEVDEYKFYVRPHTLDQWIINENFKSKVYLKKICLLPTDHWLDIGAHIGSFAISVFSKVKRVTCFEPEEENILLLAENLALNGVNNVDLVQKAVVGSQTEKMLLYKNIKKNTGSHSFYVQRGREPIEVSCVNIEEVIQSTGANKIKIDAEGAEYEIIRGIRSWESIEEIIFEFDFKKLKDKTHTKYREILSLLESYGYIVSALENPGGHWHTVVYAHRKEQA